MMKYFGINRIKLEGYKFESGFGYSKHVNLKMDGKKFVPVLISHIVNWGVKEPWKLTQKDVNCKIIDKENFLELSAEAKGLYCPSKICGFTAIRFGESPWGPYSNLRLGQIKNWKSILVDVKWVFNAKGIADLVFDLWLTKNKADLPKETDIELMVWLDYESLYPFGEKRGNFENFSIHFGDVKKTREFIPHQPCSTISYFYTKNTKKINFDLIKLILNSVKYFGIKNIKKYWIRNIDFGIEYTKNARVKAKIYKLNYKFSSAP